MVDDPNIKVFNYSPRCRRGLHTSCKGTWMIWFPPRTVPDEDSPQGRTEVCDCECHIRRAQEALSAIFIEAT